MPTPLPSPFPGNSKCCTSSIDQTAWRIWFAYRCFPSLSYTLSLIKCGPVERQARYLSGPGLVLRNTPRRWGAWGGSKSRHAPLACPQACHQSIVEQTVSPRGKTLVVRLSRPIPALLSRCGNYRPNCDRRQHGYRPQYALGLVIQGQPDRRK